ncbi:hypothetical protein H4P12_09580 [Paracoccus sp. 11-3]|uniref:Uncharacterized protein n=1 Tax=Paracoccus amoyensis TaxID=2760093 RepID=A0A926GEB2_9RHOB|nr:hypothetical protein [Paracoccus amoyensis]MBC9246961.1 hypothetical protein [Paracoccus amoyensis]
MKQLLAFSALVVVASCAQTTVTPVAKNQIMISTSAEAACGSSGSAKVASRMAAVETIRRGYERYIIVGAASANNVSVYQTGPTYASTSGSSYSQGNNTYGYATTHFGGQQTIFHGTHDTNLVVVMFNAGDPEFDKAIDAKTQLGPNWQKVAKEGVNACN